MKILILEDDPQRIKKFKQNLIGHTIVHTDKSSVCIDFLKNQNKGKFEDLSDKENDDLFNPTNCFDVLFLDRDLNGIPFDQSGINTGNEVAKWLSENLQYKPKIVVIHSLNGTEALKMQQLIPDSFYIPFIWEFIKDDLTLDFNILKSMSDKINTEINIEKTDL